MSKLWILILLFSIIFSTVSYADISYVNNVVYKNSMNSGSTIVAIPEGADFAVIGIAYWNNTPDFTSNIMTLDGQTTTLIRWNTFSDQHEGISAYYVTGFSTGSGKTFTWDFSGTTNPYEGAVYMIIFFSGVNTTNPIRSNSSNYTISTSRVIVNASVTASSTDMLVGLASGFSNSGYYVYMNLTGGEIMDGQTEVITSGLYNQARYDSAITSGATRTNMSANLTQGGLIVASLIAAESANVSIYERITDINENPVMLNASFSSFNNTTDSQGYYTFNIPKGTYDITYEIPDMIIENFWLKLLTVSITSTNYNKLIHITNYSEENKIDLDFNITQNQTVQTYSPDEPEDVSLDGATLTKYDSIIELTNNYGWYYDNTNKILHARFNETMEGSPPAAKYNLSVNSIPSGISFTVNDTSHSTNWSGMLDESVYVITMPPNFGSYQFINWTDGSTNPVRNVNLASNTTITANYELADLIISGMIAQISESEINDTTYALQNFNNRYYEQPGNAQAATYIYNRFSAIPGLSVEYQGAYNNVIATLPGTDSTSDEFYMVGAHYDTVNLTFAPGATDNGAGVAIVLELARIMSQYDFNYTIKFAAWNREESSPEGSSIGSTEYVDYAKNNNLNISLYFNYDSTCHDPSNRLILDIMNNSKSAWVAAMMTDYNTLYGIDFSLTYNVHACGSDYAHFWAHSYTAVMTHQENHNYQHTAQDTIDKVSLTYAKKNAQIGMSVIAKLAEVQ